MPAHERGTPIGRARSSANLHAMRARETPRAQPSPDHCQWPGERGCSGWRAHPDPRRLAARRVRGVKPSGSRTKDAHIGCALSLDVVRTPQPLNGRRSLAITRPRKPRRAMTSLPFRRVLAMPTSAPRCATRMWPIVAAWVCGVLRTGCDPGRPGGVMKHRCRSVMQRILQPYHPARGAGTRVLPSADPSVGAGWHP